MYSDFLDRYTKSGTPVKDLSRFSSLMHRLGDPQDGLKFIHIAGTNGKGSAVRMLTEIFIKAGYRTGEFTSPFIYRYNDRIRINGKEIPDEDIERLIGVIEPALTDEGYSQFEITNAIAFLWYAEQKCDIVILEAGMGGLLDSTNIIKDNICSLIMSISLDHTAVLGNTTAEIAAQKAGIIKEGCPCVLYPLNDDSTITVVRNAAEICGSELTIPDINEIREISVSESGCVFTYKNKEYRTAMAGRHQIYNAAAAAEAAFIAAKTYDRITTDIIAEGIAYAAVPSRMQIISRDPEIIVDGAHNPDAMKRLSEFVSSLPHSPKIMICGMNSSKDYKNAIAYISPYIDYAYCIDDFCTGTVDAEVLAGCFENAYTSKTSEALSLARKKAGNNGLIVIAGSLYIAGEILGGINMTNKITVNEQSSIRICGETVIRFDPFRIADEPHDADIVFITHEHFDHFSPEDIEKIRKDDTVFVAPESMERKLKENGIDDAVLMTAGTVTEIHGIRAEAVASYNVSKHFHPFENEWLGYVVTVGDQRIYVAGDTDDTKEAREVSCDIALIPIGGTYTMDCEQAADLINSIKPSTVIPTHYGSVVGSPSDGERFKALIDEGINVVLKL